MNTEPKRRPGRPLMYGEATTRISPMVTRTDLDYMRGYVTPIVRAGKKLRPNGRAVRRMCERSRLLDAIESALQCDENEVLTRLQWVIDANKTE